MKVNSLVYILGCLSALLLCACSSPEQKDERIARQACGSCHIFPEAGLLSKTTWEKSVLPAMAFRMGIEYSMLRTLSAADQDEVMQTLPSRPMVNDAEWESIKRYYQTLAPDTLQAATQHIADTLVTFGVERFSQKLFPLNTFVKSDSAHHQFYLGSRLNKLYRLDDKLVLKDSFTMPSPPSQMTVGDEALTLLLMGIMDPNDQPQGSLVSMRLSDGKITTIVDSLKRPVNFQQRDLDGDKLEDIIVCAFGNYSGQLVAFRNRGDGKYERKVLMSVPGARRVIIVDFDKNGMDDIVVLLSQGDEKIVVLLNKGRFDFRVNTLLRFPPVYGSSYFDLVDFNNDGKLDILYTNGDNADYSMVLKPYHGVRIFLNNGTNDFEQSWFYNMHGASQAVARDFDKDGDVDIAAISFFPDFNHHPEQGFIYFENIGSGFKPQVSMQAMTGRWLTMETCDIDRDGDADILLSALDFNSGIPGELLASWKANRTSLLLLRNKIISN